MATVPAWKRLGLKLKGPSSDGSPVSGTTTTAQPFTNTNNFSSPSAAASQYGTTTFNKRKQLSSASYPASDFKRPRRNDTNFTPLKKSVSFSQDTTKAAPKKLKKKKAPKQPPTQKQPFDLTPALEYLRTWNKARDSWKFNKNHQTLLIKYLYDSDAIPSADIDAFYTYIRDIKGASRQRLVEQAQDIRKKDMEAGPKGFSEGVKAPEEKQKEYEDMVAELLKKKAELNKSGGGSDGANSGASKRNFDEMEFVLRTVDKGIQQRIVKRMRAETVIDELESSDSSESTDPVAATTSTARTTTSRVKVAAAGDEASGNKQKTKRKKKLRTADSDSSSSSDSDSDSSDSDSNSDDAAQDAADDSASSSSSDSDSDEEMVIPDGPDEDASSSSSSSSSSESGSDSESGGAIPRTADAVEDTSGSDGDSESSDSDSEDDDA